MNTANGGIDNGMMTLLPDLKAEGWVELGTARVRGMVARHYRLQRDDGNGPVDNGTYQFKEQDYQDYYCIEGNEIDNQHYCVPWRWVMRGYNTDGGSHYDVYMFDYDEFDPIAEITEADFAQPEICSGVQAENGAPGDRGFLPLHSALLNIHSHLHAISQINSNPHFTFSARPNAFAGNPALLRARTGTRR